MTLRAETGGGAFGKIADTVKAIFAPGAPVDVTATAGTTPVDLPAAKPTFMGMPMWVPIVVGGGILVTVLFGGKMFKK